MTRVRFRHHSGLAIAGLVAFFGAIPVATYRWYLAPILLIPAAVAIWGWRAGTDADENGLTIRALLGQRRLPWSRIEGFAPAGRRVHAVLPGGATIRLVAVTPNDLPKLVAASGEELNNRSEPR
ncbi:MAG: hypothetical protein AUG44_22110 [Actinobacteria bacterium 13_1_20CM_3_71_11]|nr:MAG: hypothetical protein AUG44_22110 [Actinobacteria bacterium 13_1_20CM_3_71_11]